MTEPNPDDDPPMIVRVRCPHCNHDNDPDGSINRRRVYECSNCRNRFSFKKP